MRYVLAGILCFVAACGGSTIRAIDAETATCIRAIAAARNDDEARQIANHCHARIEELSR